MSFGAAAASRSSHRARTTLGFNVQIPFAARVRTRTVDQV